ncbi:MAG TPA: hypothetical protein HPQ03_00390 [Deltaproteobacteria bacterium]|nr:hypothetical protein [Deltaproteobacteria bacterium]
MTYNFDPEKWYDMEKSALDRRLQKGELSRQDYRQELDALDRRYEEMLDRLDGSYEIPK